LLIKYNVIDDALPCNSEIMHLSTG